MLKGGNMANPYRFNPAALRRIRLSQNLRQADMADALDVSQSTYSYWENGGASPPAEAAYFLAKLFKTDISRLFSREQGSPK